MLVALLLQMTGKLLQALGVLFVLGLVGGAIGGFLVLKDRVRVVVAADAASTGPDPVALLKDDMQTLARDVAALQQALGSNFEQLGNALEERASTRHADVQSMQKQLVGVEQRLQALAAEMSRQGGVLRSLPDQVAALGKVVATPTAAEPPAAATTTDPAAPAPVPTSPAPNEPAPASPVVEAPAGSPAGAPSKAPAKSGFLSFSVPTAPFRFTEAQDYALVGELCRVGFDAKSTLHDFTGVTSQVRGTFRADFDDPAGAWTGNVVVQAATLVTGVDGRDENMRENLDTKNHAEITFLVQGFTPAKDGIDTTKQTARGDVRGTMTIRGVTKPFTMPVAVEVDPQKRVVITGQAPLKLSDYSVPVPSQLGLINMQDEVVVWIALRARVAGGGRK